jgi:TonB family protein
MRSTFLALAALSLLVAVPIHAEPLVLKPSSAWNVDFGEDSCRLVRVFGTGDDKHFISFQQYWPDTATGLTIAGPAFKKFRSRGRTMVRFMDTQEPLATTPFTGSTEDYGTGVIFSSIELDKGQPAGNQFDDPALTGLAQVDLTLAKQVQFVELRQGGREVRLDTGPLDAAFEIMNQCTRDLVRDWGLDPEKHLTAKNRPRWINQKQIADRIMANYPSDALAQGEQGIMRMRVIVGADGAVESCTMLKATKTETLESPACKAMQRATFEPARDAMGQPFRSFYVSSITYLVR